MRLQIVIDCHDPDRLVPFWALATGYEVPPPPEGHATWRSYYLSLGEPEEALGTGDCADRLRDPSGEGPNIWFQVVPEDKTVKNRLHLDIAAGGSRDRPVAERTPDIRAKAAELIAAGATQVMVHDTSPGHFGITLLDPEGNEFCLH